MTWKLYVIHFDRPYKHAKHYTGIAINVEKRIKEHRGGLVVWWFGGLVPI